MFDNIRKKKTQNNAPQAPMAQGNAGQRINVDVNQQYSPQQPRQQQAGTGGNVQQVYTMPEQFLPQQSAKSGAQMTAGGSGVPGGGKGPKGKKKMWIILGIVIAVVLIGLVGAVAYVFIATNDQQAVPAAEVANVAAENANTANANAEDENANNANSNTNEAPTLNTAIDDVDEELNEEINESLFGNTNSNSNANTNTAQTPPDFSDVGNTTDTDQDGLTDEEEINIYETREKGPDTDGDGFIDGTEVRSLFSPIAVDETLLKSGLVIEEKNKDFGWSIYYPAPWLVEPIDEEGREVLFTPDKVDTEFVEVIVQDNDDELTAEEWYAEQYEDLDPDSIENVTVGGLNGIKTADDFTYYLADDKYIIGIIYNIGNSRDVHFKTTFEMMVDSFIYSGKKNSSSSGNSVNADSDTSASSSNSNTDADSDAVTDTDTDTDSTTNSSASSNTNAQ